MLDSGGSSLREPRLWAVRARRGGGKPSGPFHARRGVVRRVLGAVAPRVELASGGRPRAARPARLQAGHYRWRVDRSPSAEIGPAQGASRVCV